MGTAEKKAAFDELVSYVCDEIRKLGDGAETSISILIHQYYTAAGYESMHLGPDTGWVWTNDHGKTYALRDMDKMKVLTLVENQLRSEFKLDFSRYEGLAVGLPYNIQFVIRKA